MTGEFRGKRLFAGRNFAGRLFGAPVDTGGGGGMRRRLRVPSAMVDAQRLRQIDEDDMLMLLAESLCAGYGGLR
jgi:hypothetical protein